MVLGLDADSLERRSAMTDARLSQGADEGPDSPCDTGVPTPEEDTASSRIQVGADALALLDRLCHLSQGNLAERVTYLQALIDAIPSPIFFKDRMGVFVGCNAAFAEGVAGIPKEHVVGRRDEAVWGPSPLVPADGRLERAASAGGSTAAGRNGSVALSTASGHTDRFGRVRVVTKAENHRPGPIEVRRYVVRR